MLRAFFSLFLLLLSAGNVVSQELIPANPFGFVMNQPERWFSIGKEEIAAGLTRLEMSEGSLDRFLEQNQGKHLLFGYVRYKPDSFNGMNPKIEARVLKLKTTEPVTFRAFKPAAEAALRQIAKEFSEQKYIVEPSEIRIGDVASVYHISEFSITTQSGAKHRVRSRTYMIPRDTYFFQVSFVDEPAVNDLSAEFERLVKSIKITEFKK